MFFCLDGGVHFTERGQSGNWRPTTDILLTLQETNGSKSLLAIACKPDRKPLSKRTRQLLDLERTYWLVRGVDWLLVTPAEYDDATSDTLRRIQPYCLCKQVSHQHRGLARDLVYAYQSTPYSTVFAVLSGEIGDDSLAQHALWQAVFYGDLPVDLRRGWRPHLPLSILAHAEFFTLNPVASRRSAWI
jgi:hypothetical protein